MPSGLSLDRDEDVEEFVSIPLLFRNNKIVEINEYTKGNHFMK
jgi:hypothetical protein